MVLKEGGKLVDVASNSVGSKFTPFLVELCAIRQDVKHAIEAGWKRCKILTDTKLAIHNIQRQTPGNTISMQVKEWLMRNEWVTWEYTIAHAFGRCERIT